MKPPPIGAWRLCAWILGVSGLLPLGNAKETLAPVSDLLVKVGDYHLQHARMGAAAAVLGDDVFVFGGSSRGAISRAERFNLPTGEVRPLTGRFLSRRYHSVIEHQGRFYLFGGEGQTVAGDSHVASVEIYDPATDTLAPGLPMPRPRAHMGAVKLGDEAYFIGGARRRNMAIVNTGDVDIFNFATNQWRIGPPMPTSRETKAVIVDAFILAVGGFHGHRAVREVEMFVPHENQWRTLPGLARPVSAHSLAFLGPYLFLFGDYDDQDLVLAYDLRTRRTLKVAAGFKGARHTTAVVCHDRLCVIGGNTDSSEFGVSDLIQVFALNPPAPPS